MKKVIAIIICLIAAFFGWQYLAQSEVETEKQEPEEKIIVDASAVYPDEISFEKRYHYTLLDDKEKSAYEKLAEGIRNNEEGIRIRCTEKKSIEKVIRSVHYDFPEYFWFECSAGYEIYDWLGMSKVNPHYTCSGEEKKENMKAVQDYVETAYASIDGNSDYDKVRSLYDYVILNTDYVPDAENDQNILSVMKNGKSVCAGYSRSMCVLLQNLGMECIYVTGGDDNTASHAWNMVKLGENWYHLDATWGDPVYTEGSEDFKDYVSYAYLLCSDDDMLESHKLSKDFAYPACTSDEYASYNVEGTYFQKYDADAVMDKLKSAVDQKQKCVTLKFATKDVYEKAYAALTGGDLKKVMRYQMFKTVKPSAHCNYSKNDDMRTISIFFEFDG